ncbi:DUF3788 domain-containing protein [Bacteroidota bacterium]
MTDISIFVDKSIVPTDKDLHGPLGDTYPIWQDIKSLVKKKYPEPIEEWNYPGKNYGWSFRMKDKKRAIIYFLPRIGYFMVAFVFGDKAMEKIRISGISPKIIEDLEGARKYAEGRGIRIEIRDDSKMDDIEKLIDIKLVH